MAKKTKTFCLSQYCPHLLAQNLKSFLIRKLSTFDNKSHQNYSEIPAYSAVVFWANCLQFGTVNAILIASLL